MNLKRPFLVATVLALSPWVLGVAAAAGPPPPVFFSFTATPSLAKIGTTVTLRFAASKALKAHPIVKVGNQSAVFVSVTKLSYTYAVTITNDAGEGHPLVTATGTDLAGTIGTSSARPLRTDFTAPAFSRFVATPDLAGLGTSVKLTFVASEPLKAPPVVHVGDRKAHFLHEARLRYTYWLVIKRDVGEGRPNVVVRGKDLAGNPGSSSAKPLVTDYTHPSFRNITAVPPLAKRLNRVTLMFTASEPLKHHPFVRVGRQPARFVSVTGLDYVYSLVVDWPAGEGRPLVVVEGTDLAKNIGTSTARPLVTDFTPPVFKHIAVTPERAKIGTVVTLSFTASEPLKELPTLTVGNQAATFVSSSGLRYTFAATIGRSAGEGRPKVAIRGIDLAGNAGHLFVWPLVTDFTPPKFFGFTAFPPKAKLGTAVTLRFYASEPLAAVPKVTVGNQEATFVSSVRFLYTFKVVINSSAGEGRPPVVARGVDLAGNEGSSTAYPLITDSILPPSFRDFTAVPALAKLVTLVTLTVTASESLKAPPTLKVGNQDATYVSVSGLTYTFRIEINAQAGEGRPNVVARGIDLDGLVGSSTANPLVTDFSAPFCTGIEANPGLAKIGTVVSLVAKASEPLAGVPSLKVGNQDATFVSSSGLDYRFAVTIDSSAGEGQPEVKVLGTDLAGNTGGSTARPLTTDFTPPAPPSIDPMTSPTRFPQQTLAGDKPTDSGIIVTRSGQTLATTTLDVSTRWSVPVLLIEGSNALEVVTQDTAGNRSLPTRIDVVLMTIPPPAPVIVAPFVESPTPKTNQTIHGTKTAGTALDMNGTRVLPLGPETTWSQDVTASVGLNSYSFITSDAAGNVSPPIIVTITVLDTSVQAPTVDEITSPTTSTSLAVGGTKPANTSLTASVRNTAGTPGFTSSAQVPLSTATTWSIPTLQLAEGQNLLTLQCFDGSGGTSPLTTRSVLVDTTPPGVTVTGVVDGALVNDPNMVLGLSFQDPLPGTGIASVRLYLDGEEVTASAQISSGAATLARLLPAGGHLFRGEVTDGIGHTTATQSSFHVWVDDGQSRPALTVRSVRNQAFTPSNVYATGDSSTLTVTYSLSEPSQVNVTVTDSQGTLVQTTSVPTAIPGKEVPVKFDGTFSNGDLVAIGTYTVILTPTNVSGRAGSSSTTQCATYY